MQLRSIDLFKAVLPGVLPFFFLEAFAAPPTCIKLPVEPTLEYRTEGFLLQYDLTGANALDTAKAVEKRLSELRNNYPTGLKDKLAYDTTPFVKLSIESVVHTLIEAVILVFIVMCGVAALILFAMSRWLEKKMHGVN